MPEQRHFSSSQDVYNFQQGLDNFIQEPYQQFNLESSHNSIEEQLHQNTDQIPESDSQDINIILEQLKCFICYSRCKEPVMCPSCSGFACRSCLFKWVIEKKKECPICRDFLDQSKIVKCRFLDDISKLLENHHKRVTTLTHITESKTKEDDICIDHQLQQIYYCLDCAQILCSDCIMFYDQHKSHKIERAKSIYDIKVQQMNKELRQLRLKINSHEIYIQDLQNKSDLLDKSKEEKVKEMIWFYWNLNQKLEQEMESKQKQIQNEIQKTQEELDQLDDVYQSIQKQIGIKTQNEIIKTADKFLKKINDLNLKQIQRNNCQNLIDDFGKDVSIPYNEGSFVLKNYSQYKKQNQIVYSEPIIFDCLIWRIKVYPNGTGVYNGQYLSIFIELVKGWDQVGSYSYKVVLVKPGRENQNLEKEYVSEFENSICWGYNRFCKLSDLETEGYWSQDKDELHIWYFIKPSNHIQKIKDQDHQIKYLENQLKEVWEEKEEKNKKNNQSWKLELWKSKKWQRRTVSLDQIQYQLSEGEKSKMFKGLGANRMIQSNLYENQNSQKKSQLFMSQNQSQVNQQRNTVAFVAQRQEPQNVNLSASKPY